MSFFCYLVCIVAFLLELDAAVELQEQDAEVVRQHERT